jgi:hypothetical protein
MWQNMSGIKTCQLRLGKAHSSTGMQVENMRLSGIKYSRSGELLGLHLAFATNGQCWIRQWYGKVRRFIDQFFNEEISWIMSDQEFSGTSKISLLKKTGQVTYEILEGYKYFHLFLKLNLRSLLLLCKSSTTEL